MSEQDDRKQAAPPQAEPLAPLVGEAMLELFGGLTRRGRKSMEHIARRSRTRMELKQARKDLEQLHQKLGRETLRLVEAGEVTHPGLIVGVERIHQHQEALRAAEAQEAGASSQESSESDS